MFRCHPPLPPRPPLRLPLSWLTIFASFFLSEIQVSLRISSSADIFFPSAHSTANAGRVRGERYSHLCDIADVSPSRLLFNQTRSHGWIVNVFAVFRIAHTHTHTRSFGQSCGEPCSDCSYQPVVGGPTTSSSPGNFIHH